MSDLRCDGMQTWIDRDHIGELIDLYDGKITRDQMIHLEPFINKLRKRWDKIKDVPLLVVGNSFREATANARAAWGELPPRRRGNF